MLSRLLEFVERWSDLVGIEAERRPARSMITDGFRSAARICRPGLDRPEIVAWEERYGYRLPEPLKVWLELSNGLFRDGPLIHPLSAIGPMIPFARVPGLIVQPESWFELGNPNIQTVCLDLGYRFPGGGSPIFTSGDDERQSPPRLIAPSFESWFLATLSHGGREYWFEPGFQDMGDPWTSHRAHAPVPGLSERLRRAVTKVAPLVLKGFDDRTIGSRLGLSRFDVEAILRYLQHRPVACPEFAADRAE